MNYPVSNACTPSNKCKVLLGTSQGEIVGEVVHEGGEGSRCRKGMKAMTRIKHSAAYQLAL